MGGPADTTPDYNISVSEGVREDPSVLIENMLKDANPTVYETEQIASRAREFFGMLGSVV